MGLIVISEMRLNALIKKNCFSKINHDLSTKKDYNHPVAPVFQTKKNIKKKMYRMMHGINFYHFFYLSEC